ncbi:MAG: hypothetical protein K6T26_05955 [Alicyclobacillus sp.]|nr:hypothetical protein [Alicyclobacillus sp.]
MRRWLSAVSLVAAVCTAGCDHLAVPPSNAARTASQAAGALPPALAAAPETLNLPRRSQPAPPIAIQRRGDQVLIFSGPASWRGRSVQVYYVPPGNVEVRNGVQYLQSTVGVQRIGSTTLAADGSWRVVWNLHGHNLPGRNVYLLVRTDTGQIGLASFTD